MVMSRLPRQDKKQHYLKWIVLLVLLTVAFVIVLRREWIYDWFRGIIYRPAAEMVEIRDKLNLTERGEFLFNAAQPKLNGVDDFSINCRQDESEMAVLGCYTMGNIYVYDIRDSKLDGIRESSTAHELLHAVWARIGSLEKENLKPILQQVYRDNLSILKDDIEMYAEDERAEEIFVRAGTEIKRLPEILEKYYAEVFKDQDMVVDYYEKYIAVFREIKVRMDGLIEEIEALKSAINTKVAEYKTGLEALNLDIANFNNCASTEGCFMNEREFYEQRNNLITREKDLYMLNDEINNLIDAYNAKVDEYNVNAMESRKLQNMINPKVETTEIK